MWRVFCLAVLAVLVACPAILMAKDLDLTTQGASDTCNGAVFRQVDPASTGTGVIETFVRESPTGAHVTTEEGYNTDHRPLKDDPVLTDVDNSPHTHSLHLDSVPRVNLGGRWYREFLLDVNERKNNSQRLLSLDKLEIYLTADPNLIGYPFGGHATLVYDLDAAPDGDSWIKLDYALNHGSGSGDMLAYIPETAFAAAPPNRKYVILYSRFGDTLPAESGFEEWAVGKNGQALSVLGEIRGYKFHDVDGDGQDDGEPRMDGVQIFLDADGDGAWDADEAYVLTGPGGEYAFTNLVAGFDGYSTYLVREDHESLPPGWAQTTPNPPSITLDAVEKDVLVSDGEEEEFKTVTVGEVYIAYDGQGGYDAAEPEVWVEPLLAFGNMDEGAGGGGPGPFRTQTQGGWGTVAHGNNPGAYRDTNFQGAFPNGLVIGCAGGQTATFTCSLAVQDFLPAGGPPGVLLDDYVDPVQTEAGVLAGQVVALTLNVGFDFFDPNFGASPALLRDQVIIDPASPCVGWTVKQVLALANMMLGGCPAPAGLTLSQINECVSKINENYVDGTTDNGYLGPQP
ncbi:hypothetical protein ACFL09_00520 [Planctomycetota bacterium]